jgi:hypothetical protein
MVVAVSLTWLPNPPFYFSSVGVLPMRIVSPGNHLSLFFFWDSPAVIWAAYVLMLGVGSLFIAGKYPRITGMALYVLFLSFLNRNYQITYGGTNILTTLLFLTLFLDTAAKPTDKRPWWPFYLMQFQMAVGYFVSGLSKAHATEWAQGQKLYAVFMDPTFSYFSMGWLHHLPWVIALATWGVVIAETLFIFLCWFKKTRYVALFLVASMHIGIFLTMNVHFFSEIMLVGLVCFLSEKDIDWLWKVFDTAKARIVPLVRRPKRQV